MVDPRPWPHPQFPRHSLFLLALRTLNCGPGPPWVLGVSSSGKTKSCRSARVSEIPGERQRGAKRRPAPCGLQEGGHLGFTSNIISWIPRRLAAFSMSMWQTSAVSCRCRPHPWHLPGSGRAAALSCGLEGVDLPERSEGSESRASWMVGGGRVSVRYTRKPGKGRRPVVRLEES